MKKLKKTTSHHRTLLFSISKSSTTVMCLQKKENSKLTNMWIFTLYLEAIFNLLKTYFLKKKIHKCKAVHVHKDVPSKYCYLRHIISSSWFLTTSPAKKAFCRKRMCPYHLLGPLPALGCVVHHDITKFNFSPYLFLCKVRTRKKGKFVFKAFPVM